MKIAVVSEDGITISQHFGRAPFYIIVTVENGKVVSREKREKLGHAQFATTSHRNVEEARGHGFSSESQTKHMRMAAAIADCEILITGGMGAGAYENMKDAGIKPIVTEITHIDEAVKAYIEGKLIDRTERID